jgi:hypothetical protein
MFFRLISIVLFLTVSHVCAENTLATEEEPDSDQSDIYYNAMIRSIDLDKTRWKAFSRSMESGPWFYDTQSLKRNGNKATVLVTVFPHPQKTAIYSSVYSDHSNIKKIVFETEINCNAHTYRQPQIRVYGYYKELLANYSTNKKRNYSPIKTGTTTDTLRSMVCGPGKKKKS